MSLPDFLVIGAMKGGTTALHAHLRLHPGIWMPGQKELDFFCAQGNWSRGLSWYEAEFAPAPAGAVLGEASPNYAKLPVFDGVPERIARTLPDVRLVYVLRHPIDRMRSHWLHQVADGRTRRSVNEALRVSDDHLLCSSYGMQLAAYLEHFDREQILLVRSEDLRSDPATTVRTICAFIGAGEPPPGGARAARRAPHGGQARAATRSGAPSGALGPSPDAGSCRRSPAPARDRAGDARPDRARPGRRSRDPRTAAA